MKAAEPQIVESPYFQDVPLAETQLRNSIMAPRIDGANEIINGSIFAKALVIGAQNWITTLVWTATDYNTASWSSGTLQLVDGTVYNIVSGDTGNIAAKTFVYFDPSVSQTVLQTTTTYSDAVGDSKILLAFVEAAGDTSAKSVMTVLNGTGTTIDGSKITTGRIQSTDQKTYFDLDAKRIIINDGTNDRGLFGFQSGGF